MPQIRGILETALYVDDIERAGAWYKEVFGFEELLNDGRLLALNVAPRNVLLIFKRGASDGPNPMAGSFIPAHDGGGKLHFALSVAADELDSWRELLQQKNVVIESEITPPQGGHSLYFRDLDGNLVELATPGLWPNDTV